MQQIKSHPPSKPLIDIVLFNRRVTSKCVARERKKKQLTKGFINLMSSSNPIVAIGWSKDILFLCFPPVFSLKNRCHLLVRRSESFPYFPIRTISLVLHNNHRFTLVN